MGDADNDQVPALYRRADGETRRVGVELEYSGLDIESSAKLVSKEFGGRIDPVSAYECKIRDTEFGDFQVELDFGLLKQIGRDGAEEAADDESEQLPERLLASVAEALVPFEIVTPPLPMHRLGELEELIERLRREGAQGTRHSAFYAFGLHLNPEMPDTDAATVLAYMQAFACLYPWLVRVGEIDWSRRFTVYIQPYPNDYVRAIIDRDYSPAIETLIDDYLKANPAR
ncbi:MAG: amidoligase family protein, partial [Gammaproteobacteria bacterium]|nr:amidoligase family protein [Gammaproteobacteria bacterium]